MQDESYEIDEEDNEWIQQQQANNQLPISIDDFELIIGELERASTKTVASMALIFVKLPQFERKVLATIYDYWLEKRLVSSISIKV